jgi:hypothetical protein
MDRDMAFRQHRYAGDSAIGLEMVQMDMQQRGAGCVDAAAQRLLDMLHVVEAARMIKIDDKMRAGTGHAVAHHEMILVQVARGGPEGSVVFSGGTWSLQALPRSQEGVFRHAALPNQRSNP